MNIVTAADSGFFHCLKELADSVRKFYDKPLIVYDIGLKPDEKQQLDAIIIPIEISEKVDHKGRSLICNTGIASTRATHKPFCVKKYFENYTEPMILVDADCLFTTRVEESGFDVAVTRAPSKKNVIYENGILNSGVIFFNTPAAQLVDRWAVECEKEKTTDQKALSDILNETIDWDRFNKLQDWHGLKIKVLDARTYNDYHLTKKGKILHFINTKHDKGIYEKLIAGCKQGKDIRKMFRWIKRGKKTRIERLTENIRKLFKITG